MTWTGLVPGVSYQIAEVPQADWDAGPAVCSGASGDQTRDATFMPAAGDTVSCTVKNTAELPPAGTDPAPFLTIAAVALGLGFALRRAARASTETLSRAR